MSRLTASLALFCAVALSALALVAPAGARLGSSPSAATPAAGGATAALEACHSALDQADRSATFSGEMTTLTDARRMAVRVDLVERPAGGQGFRAVSAPGLGVWRRSASNVQIYRYVKQVINLPAPAAFRAVVGFRWLDVRGRVMRQVQRRTGVCEQPDERPLLRVGSITQTSTPGSAEATYGVTVRNNGRGPSGAFSLQLTVDGAVQPELTVAGLPAFGRLEVDTSAPRCGAGGALTVTLDPRHQIAEAVGGGQARTVACPATAQASGIGQRSRPTGPA
jgi:CARDB protein